MCFAAFSAVIFPRKYLNTMCHLSSSYIYRALCHRSGEVCLWNFDIIFFILGAYYVCHFEYLTFITFLAVGSNYNILAIPPRCSACCSLWPYRDIHFLTLHPVSLDAGLHFTMLSPFLYVFHFKEFLLQGLQIHYYFISALSGEFFICLELFPIEETNIHLLFCTDGSIAFCLLQEIKAVTVAHAAVDREYCETVVCYQTISDKLPESEWQFIS